jgi:hypothetical protein
VNLEKLTDDEKPLVKHMIAKISDHAKANKTHEDYYDGSFRPGFLGIGLPKNAEKLEMVTGWPATAVDVLEERLDITGFGDDETLTDIFTANSLDTEASQVHLDALIYGMSFASVTAGGPGEPEVLIRGHDAKSTTGVFNPRTKRLDAALSRETNDDGDVTDITLWTPAEIVTAHREKANDPWNVIDRTPHGLGRVPMVAFINRPRAGDRAGRSEISKAVRRYTDSAVRSLTSMDVNREFFSAPQRYLIGADDEQFVGADGKRTSSWQIVTGRLWSVPTPEEGEQPKLGQFDPMSPGPYLDQVRGLAQLLAAEAAIPASYLGFTTENPSSADAIRQMEARLVKRAERRQVQFGHSWSEIGRLALASATGESADAVDRPAVQWAEASTPTFAATVDGLSKLVQNEMVPKNSAWVWDQLGLPPETQRQLKAELAQQRMSELSATGQGVTSQAVELARMNRQSGSSDSAE